MNIISLPIEYDRHNIDSKFRIIAIASQRAKELSVGAKPKVKTKAKKVTTISLEETLSNTIEFLIGDQAKKAKEESKRFDYRKILEEKKKEISGEDLTEFEKDLKVYLHEKESMDKRALEGLFNEKREENSKG
ncbi:MAG: DNA-directed RNA polymerase subunit omega [Nitrospirae bacterium RBG_13_39_12]|nr:MAG: DNA-directed RNA polymerase subunit omega [Nitrospirae bacterium RBG_13_39_12]